RGGPSRQTPRGVWLPTRRAGLARHLNIYARSRRSYRTDVALATSSRVRDLGEAAPRRRLGDRAQVGSAPQGLRHAAGSAGAPGGDGYPSPAFCGEERELAWIAITALLSFAIGLVWTRERGPRRPALAARARRRGAYRHEAAQA